MTTKYSSLLAVTKFRTRLGRSIVTVIAASLVASIMLIASFVIAGINGSISGVSQTPISRLNVAQETIFTRLAGEHTKQAASSVTTPPPVAMTLAEYQQSIAKYNPQAVYEDQSLGGFTITDPAPPQNNGQVDTQTLTARSDVLYTASLDTTTPPPVVTGSYPAAVSSDIILNLANISFSDTDTASFKVSQTLNAENTWRGKVLTLTASDPTVTPQQIKITVEGFLPSSGLFGSGNTNSILMSLSVAHSIMANFPAATTSNTTFYASFASQSALLSFTQNEQSPRGTTGSVHFVNVYGNPLVQFQEFEGQLKSILTYVIIVMLIAVILAMMTTLSKIIADSERETGVFRAIGAKVTDILQIYISYSLLVSVLAMLLALIIGGAFTTFLTAHYSNNLTYELISLSGSANLTTHVTLFGVNWPDLGGVFLAIILAGLIGTMVPLISLLRKDPIKALRAE